MTSSSLMGGSPGAADDLAQRQLYAELQAKMFARGEPVQLGRYLLRHVLGRGAMGVVYAAVDPELDREVAVKVLQAALDPDAALERLRNEARTVARVNHPHVVEIYDVGAAEERVFISMELVVGASLDVWLEAERPGWARIVEVFAQAGEGLWAAHRAGVVHRDFKPSNVLVGDDGRVRVVDFGLARFRDSAGRTHPSLPGIESRPNARPSATSVAGTPRYMAPEHLRGAEASPRCDQFSFCVALYEALCGRLPYDPGAVARHPERLAPPALAPDIPARVRPVLRRGLSVRPEDRFADMGQLLGALRRSLHVGRRRARLAASLAIVAVVGTASWASASSPETAPPPAPTPEEPRASTDAPGLSPEIDAVWTQIEAGEYGPAAAAAEELLSHARATDDAPLVAQARLARGVALVWAGEVTDGIAELEAAHTAAVESRTRAVRGRAAVELARAQLQERNDLAAAELWAKEAKASEPLEGRAAMLLAQLGVELARQRGDVPAMIAAAERAVALASDAGGPSLGLAMAQQGYALALATANRLDEARTVGKEALATIIAAEGPEHMLVAGCYATLSAIESQAATQSGDNGALQRAVEWNRKLVQARQRSQGADHYDTVVARANLGILLARAGNKRAAVVELERALEKLERLRGTDDPQYATTTANLGFVKGDLGELAEAETLLQRAVVILETQPGKEAVLATVLDGLASVQEQAGHRRAARRTRARIAAG